MRKALQPPFVGGILAGRAGATRVCQSIGLQVDLQADPFSSRALATGARLVSTPMSVECISTTGVPS